MHVCRYVLSCLVLSCLVLSCLVLSCNVKTNSPWRRVSNRRNTQDLAELEGKLKVKPQGCLCGLRVLPSLTLKLGSLTRTTIHGSAVGEIGLQKSMKYGVALQLGPVSQLLSDWKKKGTLFSEDHF